MPRRVGCVDLKTLVYRYQTDQAFLKREKLRGEKDQARIKMLERRIEKHRKDIADYVSSDRFKAGLDAFNL